MVDLSKAVRLSRDALRTCNYSDIRKLYKVAQLMYHAMIQQYDYADELNDVKQQYRICELIDQEVLPKLRGAISNTKSKALANDIYELHKLFFALSSRRILKNFALYMEQYKNKKVWNKTMDTVETMFYYADRFSIYEDLNLMRASLMPSMGKTFFANLFVAQSVGNNPNVQILRITYAEDLCGTTTDQTTSIIDSKAFREIFPRYAGCGEGYGKGKIFKSVTKDSFCMIDNEDEYNLFAATRDGRSTGKRANILIIDDLLKDDSESYNKALHQKYVDRYESTWSSRAEGDNLKIMLLGTMWADTDLLNVVHDRAQEDEELIPSPIFKYTEVAKSGSCVFIGIPALDENDITTVPLRYSTSFLKKKRKHMSTFLWMCVYQQSPIAPDGLEFDDSALNHYDELPKGDFTVYASLDPARKGKNYVSMPFTKKFGDEELYYLFDWLYRKKSMDELYDDITDKIIEHRVSHLVLENNTDTSLRFLINEKLKRRGYFGCTIVEKFSSANKEQRIKDNQGYMRNNIVYPRKENLNPATELGKAMGDFRCYSFEYPNKFDDAPDSIALLAMEYIKKQNKLARARAFDRRLLGM